MIYDGAGVDGRADPDTVGRLALMATAARTARTESPVHLAATVGRARPGRPAAAGGRGGRGGRADLDGVGYLGRMGTAASREVAGLAGQRAAQVCVSTCRRDMWYAHMYGYRYTKICIDVRRHVRICVQVCV